MRISQRMMYNNFLTGMNDTLSSYMETNIQSASQKRINRPSDDPVGMQRVLSYRASLARNEQYITNSKQVHEHLASTDSALTQTQVILSKIREKMNQFSTGTVTPENRRQAASEVRELFNQMINLANTAPGGQQLFAGHQTDEQAYQQGLGISTTSEEVLNVPRVDGSSGPVAWDVQGSADKTIAVRFYTDNNGSSVKIGDPAGGDVKYVYTKDGGQTWTEKTLAAGDNVLDLDGATITIPLPPTAPNAPDPSDPVDYVTVKGYVPEEGDIYSRDNGTVLFVRPTAHYQGDTVDLPPLIDSYGTSDIAGVSAFGSFSKDIRVRVDAQTDVGLDGEMTYSYSLDNGITWLKAANATTHNGSNTVRLEVPGGGYLDISAGASGILEEGQQFVIRPRRAEAGLEVNQGEFMNVTNVGKDIFGGLYVPDGYRNAVAAEGGDRNVFEVVSDFVAWAESGVQEGCQEELAAMETAMNGLLTKVAQVGGQMNRVSLNVTMLETNSDDKQTRMSSIEDIDLTTLLTKLTQQQMAYQSVLQSSSMIMGLNLTKYL